MGGAVAEEDLPLESHRAAVERQSARLNACLRAANWGVTIVYSVCVALYIYWDTVGMPSLDDFSFPGDTRRNLQVINQTLGYDPFNCTFPRPDGKLIPNPSCRHLASIITIPFINGLVGGWTNWVALKMTFYPYEFWGINLVRFKDQPVGLFGWQGIIPTKAAKMAQKSVRMMTEKLFNVNEIFKRVDPKLAVEHMRPGFLKVMKEVLDEQVTKMFPAESTFASFAPTIKTQMLSWAEAEMGEFAEGFMEDLVANLDKVFDLEYMVVNEFTENKHLLVKVFTTVGDKEMTFIVNSGYFFGFLFGLVLLPISLYFPFWFILPIVGFCVGYVTDVIALWMMFKPLDPHILNFGCFKYNHQGIFIKRQQEASAVFAKLTVKQILHSRYMFHYMLNGPKRAAFRAMLVEHTNRFVDKTLGRAHTVVRAYMGEDEFQKMRKDIEDQTLANVEDIFSSLYAYTDQALKLEDEIRSKMQGLPARDFEGVLHPVFQEDEIKLIIVGAILGGIVGFIQTSMP